MIPEITRMESSQGDWQGDWQLVSRRKVNYQGGGNPTLAGDATRVTVYDPFKPLYSQIVRHTTAPKTHTIPLYSQQHRTTTI